MASGKISNNSKPYKKVANGIGTNSQVSFDMTGYNEIIVIIQNSGNHFCISIPRNEVGTSSEPYISGDNSNSIGCRV